jgi:hypothetical protein
MLHLDVDPVKRHADKFAWHPGYMWYTGDQYFVGPQAITYTGMFSTPIYDELRFDPKGRSHLIAGVATGRWSIDRLAAQSRALAATFTVIYDPDPVATLAEPLSAFFSKATMGLRVYFAGPESFLWTAMRTTARFGFGKGEIQLELTGQGRDVYCVHCKHVTSQVAADVCTCACCGLLLDVRDHFSRRLGSYMGVCEQV